MCGAPPKFVVVWAGLNARGHHILRGVPISVGRVGEQDLSMDTEPDGSDGACIKRHYGAMKGAS